MDNLLKIGISQETIDSMIDKYGIYDVDKLNKEYYNTFSIINALRELKIHDDRITLLLNNYIDLFLMKYDKFIEKLRDKDLNKIGISINADIESVEDIFLN